MHWYFKLFVYIHTSLFLEVHAIEFVFTRVAKLRHEVDPDDFGKSLGLAWLLVLGPVECNLKL